MMLSLQILVMSLPTCVERTFLGDEPTHFAVEPT